MASRQQAGKFDTLGKFIPDLEPEFDDEYGKAEGRTRRAVYVFGFTLLFACAAALITLLGYNGAVAEKAVQGFLDLIQLMIIFYLSTTTIDRSEVLTNVGKGFRARAEQPQIVVQTPEQARAAASQVPDGTTTVQTTGPVTVQATGDDSVG